ncbi:MAG: ferredoxin [Thaumarchaeota archaeon]|jgi:ferredoxin|nr:ferredoxin [Nitrososphaerota archaeon]
MTKYRVKVDKDTCIACGVCYSTCPDVFEPDEENRSQVVSKYRSSSRGSEGIIDDSVADCAQSARDTCPVQAITVEPVE